MDTVASGQVNLRIHNSISYKVKITLMYLYCTMLNQGSVGRLVLPWEKKNEELSTVGILKGTLYFGLKIGNSHKSQRDTPSARSHTQPTSKPCRLSSNTNGPIIIFAYHYMVTTSLYNVHDQLFSKQIIISIIYVLQCYWNDVIPSKK